MAVPRRTLHLLGAAILAFSPVIFAQAPRMPQRDLQVVRDMLRDAYDVVRDYYYDPHFHGVALDARYREFDERMKALASADAGMALVERFLEGLGDSHTIFYPPSRPYDIEWGYDTALVGDAAFITRVRPGSVAEGKLRAGDRLVRFNGTAVLKDNYRRLRQQFDLGPQTTRDLVVQDPAGVERSVTIEARVTPRPKVKTAHGTFEEIELENIRQDSEASGMFDNQATEVGEALVWKMPSFELSADDLRRTFDAARNKRALIVDLRHNPGGYLKTLIDTLGPLFAADVVLGDQVSREGKTRLKVKGKGAKAFSGQVVVLIDSRSGSAAEMFARVVQLEKRGVVIGDRSAGAVMGAQLLTSASGSGIGAVLYAFYVTTSDILMRDGESLEHRGVLPDEVVLPTADDIAAGRDPVLARAAQLAGVSLDPVTAGRMFPYRWK